MSKLIFAKPPLRFQEVPDGKQMAEEKVMAQTGVREFSPKLAVSEGIFWSPYVERMVPKGNIARKILRSFWKINVIKSWISFCLINMVKVRNVREVQLIMSISKPNLWCGLVYACLVSSILYQNCQNKIYSNFIFTFKCFLPNFIILEDKESINKTLPLPIRIFFVIFIHNNVISWVYYWKVISFLGGIIYLVC